MRIARWVFAIVVVFMLIITVNKMVVMARGKYATRPTFDAATPPRDPRCIGAGRYQAIYEGADCSWR